MCDKEQNGKALALSHLTFVVAKIMQKPVKFSMTCTKSSSCWIYAFKLIVILYCLISLVYHF